MRRIAKNFGGVRALRGVDFDLHAGEVHALLGENGAGKSTLIKVATGAHAPDSGEITVGGKTDLTPNFRAAFSDSLGQRKDPDDERPTTHDGG